MEDYGTLAAPETSSTVASFAHEPRTHMKHGRIPIQGVLKGPDVVAVLPMVRRKRVNHELYALARRLRVDMDGNDVGGHHRVRRYPASTAHL